MSAAAILALLEQLGERAAADVETDADARVPRELCLGAPTAKHLSGGACTALLTRALERTTGRPLIQSSVQFQQAPLAGAPVRVRSAIHRAGRSIVLAGAELWSEQGCCARMLASLGERSSDQVADWEHGGSVADPDTCSALPFVRADEGDLHTHLDVRLASEPGAGRLDFWVAGPGAPGQEQAAMFLALVADYLPEAVHFNLGKPTGAVSLDNELRLLRRETSSWILCRVRLSAVRNGLFHGRIALFSQDGQLLATGSQSGATVAIEGR